MWYQCRGVADMGIPTMALLLWYCHHGHCQHSVTAMDIATMGMAVVGITVTSITAVALLPWCGCSGVIAMGIAPMGITTVGVATRGIIAVGATAVGIANVGITAVGIATMGITTMASMPGHCRCGHCCCGHHCPDTTTVDIPTMGIATWYPVPGPQALLVAWDHRGSPTAEGGHCRAHTWHLTHLSSLQQRTAWHRGTAGLPRCPQHPRTRDTRAMCPSPGGHRHPALAWPWLLATPAAAGHGVRLCRGFSVVLSIFSPVIRELVPALGGVPWARSASTSPCL